MIEIRKMKPDEWNQVADLIFRSTNHWYETHGLGKIFPGDPSDCLVFCEVYEDLDPDQCWVAVDSASQKIVGSCFFHPRATHCSLGIMNTDPGYSGKGTARQLLEKLIELSNERQQSLRLFSSAFNLDSFSLYNRQGFQPYGFFQDMLIEVPEEGFGISIHPHVRPATLEDLGNIDALERRVWETSRIGDWEYFIKNERDVWNTFVFESSNEILGVLASIQHPGSNMIGPGVMVDDPEIAEALIVAQLEANRGRKPVFLLPSTNASVLARMYSLKARNCEIHFAQSLGNLPSINGIVMPSFLPESG